MTGFSLQNSFHRTCKAPDIWSQAAILASISAFPVMLQREIMYEFETLVPGRRTLYFNVARHDGTWRAKSFFGRWCFMFEDRRCQNIKMRQISPNFCPPPPQTHALFSAVSPVPPTDSSLEGPISFSLLPRQTFWAPAGHGRGV